MFKFNQENNNGSFNVELKRDLTEKEASQIMQFAMNLLYSSMEPIRELGPMYGPLQQSYYTQDTGSPIKINIPSIELNSERLGTYKEPKDGVRLKILSLTSSNKIRAIKLLREKTGITLYGSRDVILGTSYCPKLKPEVAEEILAIFKTLDVHAKIATIETSARPS
jgi:hypothetical protein